MTIDPLLDFIIEYINDLDWRDLIHVRDRVDQLLNDEVNRRQARDGGGSDPCPPPPMTRQSATFSLLPADVPDRGRA